MAAWIGHSWNPTAFGVYFNICSHFLAWNLGRNSLRVYAHTYTRIHTPTSRAHLETRLSNYLDPIGMYIPPKGFELIFGAFLREFGGSCSLVGCAFFFFGATQENWGNVRACVRGVFVNDVFSSILSFMCFGECCVFFAAIYPTDLVAIPLADFWTFHWVLCDPSRSGFRAGRGFQNIEP